MECYLLTKLDETAAKKVCHTNTPASTAHQVYSSDHAVHAHSNHSNLQLASHTHKPGYHAAAKQSTSNTRNANAAHGVASIHGRTCKLQAPMPSTASRWPLSTPASRTRMSKTPSSASCAAGQRAGTHQQ